MNAHAGRTAAYIKRDDLVHASERMAEWRQRWEQTGRFVLLLDFDGTLAPIVERPELARMLPAARDALARLVASGTVDATIVSGRGLHDARELVAMREITYAGNHGMEIEGPSIERIHPEAAAARPSLVAVSEVIRPQLQAIPGALLEDKGLTLSVHYRLVPDVQVGHVRELVREATSGEAMLRVTEGKKVLEIRPRVEWDKGKAILFLLEQIRPGDGVPVVYLGDDVTDEDGFRALRDWPGGEGEGVIVADSIPETTAASSFLRSPVEAAALLEGLAEAAPARPDQG